MICFQDKMRGRELRGFFVRKVFAKLTILTGEISLSLLKYTLMKLKNCLLLRIEKRESDLTRSVSKKKKKKRTYLY